MTAKPQLNDHLIRTIATVMDNHPDPTMETVAADAADQLEAEIRELKKVGDPL